VIGEEHEHARPEALLDRPGRIGDDERSHSQPSEHPHPEHRLVGADPLVEVRAALEDRDRHVVDLPEDEHARVPHRGRDRPAGDLAVRDLDPVPELVREAAEAAPEHHADPRLELRHLPDPQNRLVEHYAEPSATRPS
jgi:hypothetical protein